MRNLSALSPFLLIGAIICAFFLYVGSASAQTASVLVSYSTKTTAPNSYQGKRLATRGEAVWLAASLLENGRLVDPSLVNWLWIVDGKTLQGGVGVATVSFLPESIVKNQISLRLLATYQGREYEEILTIPLVAPALVVEAPYPNLLIRDKAVSLKAVPYFFPSENPITFEWTANGDSLSFDGEKAAITFEGDASGANIFIKAQARTANFLRDFWFKTFRLE